MLSPYIRQGLKSPQDLRGFGTALADLSPIAVYTLAFFCFWLVVALASSMTLLLASPEPEVQASARRWP